jgi:diguanylate cyclase (GGDEF)-like protein
MFLQIEQFPPLQRFVLWLERLPRGFLIGACLLAVGGLASLNFLVFQGFSFALLYLVPVAIAAWFINLRFSLAIALLCSLGTIWVSQGSASAQLFWNAFSLWGIFAVVALLINTLKISSEMEKQLLRTDTVTGAINRLFFTELLEAELQRSSRYRYPLTLALLNLKTLPQLREQLGTEAEEEFLYKIVDQISESLRANDVVARLSPTQFAILLPQTNSKQSEQVFSRLMPPLQSSVQQLNFESLSYLVAVTTFEDIPDTLDEVLGASEEFAQNSPEPTETHCIYQTLP